MLAFDFLNVSFSDLVWAPAVTAVQSIAFPPDQSGAEADAEAEAGAGAGAGGGIPAPASAAGGKREAINGAPTKRKGGPAAPPALPPLQPSSCPCGDGDCAAFSASASGVEYCLASSRPTKK